MPRNADGPRAGGPPPRRPGRGRFCCSGCALFGALFALAFLIAFNSTGRYRPRISPPPPVPNPNALDDYIAAGILFEANGGDKPMYDAHGLPSLLNQSSVVQANQPALARLRTGFSKECGIPFNPSLDVRFEELAQMRSLARLLSAEADVYDAGGNPGRAVHAGLDAMQMGTDIQHGGTLIHCLTGTALQAIGHASVLRRVGKLDQKQCDAAISRLKRILANQVSAQSVLETEYRWSLTNLARMDAKDYGRTIGPDGEETTVGSPMLNSFAWHFMRDKTLRDLEQYMDRTAQEAGKPAASRRNVAIPGGLAGMYAPAFDQAVSTLNRSTLRNRLLIVEIAIRQYRLEHGALPRTIDDLGLSPSLISDPESGRPVVYKPHGRDYLLYGVGPDGKDDGGTPADEGMPHMTGDLGIRPFRMARPGSPLTNAYRLVPHMLPPKLPAGAPPLKD